MKTNSPTHEEISQRAQQIWRARGQPDGCDTEIWLEAERQLATANPTEEVTSGMHSGGHGISQTSEAGAKAAQQKKEARAPKLPAKSAPRPEPPESGKPLWDRPHSA